MNIIFFGTPEFSVSTLKALAKEKEINVDLVITQRDKKVGRKQKLEMSPIKKAAKALKIKVKTPNTKKEIYEIIKDKQVDFLVVIAYGKILGEKILHIPKYKAINVHASILPKYRGASPIHQSLVNGDKETGITFMEMAKEMDTGNIYSIKKINISENDDILGLNDKLSKLSALHIVETLKAIKNTTLKSEKQDETQASYCNKIKKEDGKIDFKKENSTEIINKHKAYKIWPSIYFIAKGKKIYLKEIKRSEEKLKIGEIKTTKNQIFIGTKKGSIEVERLQLESKKEMTAKDFLNGFKTFLI